MDQVVAPYLCAVVISAENRFLLATEPGGEEDEETVHCVDRLQICSVNGVTSERAG